MSIPDNPRRKQAQTLPAAATLVPAALDVPDTDHASGPTLDTCPTCGRPYFGPASSQLLDLVVLTHEQLGHIKAMLETVVVS